MNLDAQPALRRPFGTRNWVLATVCVPLATLFAAGVMVAFGVAAA